MLVTDPNVVWLLVTVLFVALCSWLPHLLPAVCFIKSFLAHVVFERSTEGGWHNSSDGQVIWVARLSSNSKNRENPLFNNNKKSFLLKHVCETMNNKKTRFAFLPNRWKNIERGRVKWGVVRVTLTSLKSETLNFCNVWMLFRVLQI